MEDDVLPELRNYGPSLTTDEASTVLHLHRATVSRLLARGELPGFMVAGQWRLRRADVQAVMLGQWSPPDGHKDSDQS